MRIESKKFLYDINKAVNLVFQFAEDKAFDDYVSNPMFRSAVERQMMIIGEALTKLHRVNPSLVEGVNSYKKIIGFSNIIVHGYDIIDDETVWGIVKNILPEFHAEIAKLQKINWLPCLIRYPIFTNFLLKGHLT